ncbi:hypothetical protein GGQ69_000813 [Micrococcus sp. TA1]|nr:hypothetical protein [Micrococcus sp. TA1]
MTVWERKQRLRIAIAVLVSAILFVAAMATMFFIGRGFQLDAQRAQEKTLTLAEQVILECANGKVEVSGYDVCAEAKRTKKEITENIVVGEKGDPGPAGPPGRDGAPGEPGEDGEDGLNAPTPPAGRDGEDGQDGKPGQDGAQGPQGATGEPGPTGPQGEPGKPGERGPAGPTGPPGPAGKDSNVPGPRGPAGERGPAGPTGAPGRDGAAGVGIRNVSCTGEGADSRWTITLTDGNTIIATGPCKAAIAPTP